MSNKLTGAETRLEKRVQRIVNSSASDGYSVKSWLEDLLTHGCQSGMVGELIYTSDCVKFYNLYRKEIDAMYAECVQEFGHDFKLNGWDDEDPLAREDQNKNVLAWFGFEETSRKLADRNGIEV